MRRVLFGLIMGLAFAALFAAPAGATEEQAAVARANRGRVFQGTGLGDWPKEQVLERIGRMPEAVPWDVESVRGLFFGVVDDRAVQNAVLNNFYAVWEEHLRSRPAPEPGGKRERPSPEALKMVPAHKSVSTGDGPGSARMSPLDLSDLTRKILELSNWFFGVAGIFLAVVIAWRGLSLAFADSPNRRSEIKDLFLQIVVGGSLVFGSWLVVAVLKGLFLD
jgi:hypothetical protein